ncbi:hypothetical protein C3L33_17729, partial [Rhododendron williamsianum]
MEAPSWAVLALTWLASIALFHYLTTTLGRCQRGHKLKYPPGPRPWPIIGNLNLDGSVPHLSFHNLSRKYGDIMQLRSAPSPSWLSRLPRWRRKSCRHTDPINGGTDTSAMTVEWAISELLKQPRLLQKATEELDRVVGGDRDPRYGRNQKSSYEGFWEKYRVKGHHFELLPFGSGRRMCPAYRLGLMLIQSTLANLVHGFKWGLPGNVKPEDVDMEEEYGLTTHRKNPIVVVVEPDFLLTSMFNQLFI